MKSLAYIFIIVLAFGIGFFVKPYTEPAIEKRIDTVFSSSVLIKRDTIPYYLPMPVLCWRTGDSIRVGDTVVQVEQKVYRDSDYTAYVSGYRSQLDSFFVYPKTTIVTNDVYHTIKIKQRWGLSITAGYGLCKDGLSPAVVIGVSYRIW